MKKNRGCLFTAFVAVIVAFVWAWYSGLIPIGDSQARAGLRHAVDLRMLPSGVTVNSSGVESWADYIFEVDISIDPASFEELLEGRDFIVSKHLMYGMQSTEAYRIPGYSGFEVSEVWHWEDVPEDAPEGGIGTRCTIYTNSERNRAFVRYSSD